MSGASPSRSATALLQSRALRSGSLLTLQVEVTSRCPLRCAHCYNDRSVADRLDVETMRRVLTEAAGLGCLFVTFTGGEVYAHPEFHELVSLARSLDFDVRFQTSGWHLDARAADFVREQAVSEVHLSLYSADAAVHDAVTQVPGSHERAMAALRGLRARGVRVVLKTLITSINEASYRTVEAVAARNGCSVTIDATVTPCETGSCGPCGLRPSDATLREFYGDYAWHQLVQSAPRGRVPATRSLDETPCLAGATALYIASDGQAYPCVDLKIACGDVRRESLVTIWREAPGLRRLRGLRWRDLPACAACSVRDYCVHCLAVSLQEHGDLLAPALENCRHAAVRRDLLRERGLLQASDTALPPPLERAAGVPGQPGSAVELPEELRAGRVK